MIDSVCFYIPETKTNRVPFFIGDSSRLAPRRIPDRFDRKFVVTLQPSKHRIKVQASLPKLLQGHNVFGSNKMFDLCLAVTELVYEGLELEMTDRERDLLIRRGFRVGRADLTVSFPVGSEANVIAVLYEIRNQLLAKGQKISSYENAMSLETVYVDPRSSWISIKFYNKYLELLNNSPLPFDLSMRDRLLDAAKSLVRMEITMRWAALKYYGLDWADAWSTKLVREIVCKHLTEFNFTGIVKGSVDLPDLNDLKPDLRTTYGLWASGADVRRHYHPATFKRRQHDLLALLDVDIGRRPRSSPPMSLRTVLSPTKMRFNYPRWLRQAEGVFTVQ